MGEIIGSGDVCEERGKFGASPGGKRNVGDGGDEDVVFLLHIDVDTSVGTGGASLPWRRCRWNGGGMEYYSKP